MAESSSNRTVLIFEHGSLQAEFWFPRGRDRQCPHTRDEIYLVARGEAVFFDGGATHQVQRGSFVFVPAGQEHRFEEFSPDFAVWVVFYGPEGGEANRRRYVRPQHNRLDTAA